MNKRGKSITVLIPVYNEELVLPELYKRLTKLAKQLSKYSLEFLFINDGSDDGTLSLLKQFAITDNKVSYLSLSRNFGKEAAMLAGLDKSSSHAVIIMDADLQDPPELIPDMVRYWEQGYDDIYAKRSRRNGEGRLKRITASVFYKILQKSSRIETQPDSGDFRMLDKRCVAALVQIRESQRYTKGMFSWIGYKKKEILYDRDARAAGAGKWSFLQLTDLALDGLTASTTSPLRAASVLGIVISLLAFLYILFILIKTSISGIDMPGYASLMAVMLFLGGVQLFTIGIVGEYVGRIFNETKRRPLYFLDEYHRGPHKK